MIPAFPHKLAVSLAAGALLLAACGDDDSDADSSAPATRTIEIDMQDIEFSPASVDVAPGETVRFVFHNRGAVVHDAFVGDEAAQEDHEMEMRGSDEGDGGMDHGGGHGEGGITVDPGDTSELTHTFQAGDEAIIGCHQEGHYEAGMKLTVNVE